MPSSPAPPSPTLIPLTSALAAFPSRTSPPSPSIAAPRIPPTPPPAPMAAAYWLRLKALLVAAEAALPSLRPPADTPAKCSASAVALVLQGLTAADVTRRIASVTDPRWHAAHARSAHGAFAVYGVPSTHAAWVAHRLLDTSGASAGAGVAAATEPALNDATAHADAAAEAARVRVWEAEPALLPVAFAERLVAARRRMRRFKQRVELCVKILAALEGVGRKLAPAALDRAKIALEKAEVAAEAEEKRLEAARVVREEREKKAAMREEKKLEKLKEKEVKGKNRSSAKKRRHESAAASFMKKFVKRKIESEIVVHLDDEGGDQEGAAEVVNVAVETALPRSNNRDVMSVAWWLLSEMEAPGTRHMDASMKVSAREEWSALSELKRHLEVCGRRRKVAEGRAQSAMAEYRRQRTTHTDDRTPAFAAKRADVRGRGIIGPIKLLQFCDDHRPAFYGTRSKRSRSTRARRPHGKDDGLDYACDSAEEWEDEEEDGEDLSDLEAENERANEDAELKILYGSDEEDDDDFLDDGDVEDDGDDGDADDADSEGENVGKGEEGTTAADSLIVGTEPNRLGLPLAPGDAVDSAVAEKKIRSPKRGASGNVRRKRKRHDTIKNSVVIHEVSFPVAGEASPLDRYEVTVLEGAPGITMYNPYISRVSDFLQESSAPRPAPVRIPRTNLDDGVKLDLALALVTASTRTSRDNIVYQFCESRKARGLPVPAKIEVVRAIREIGTNEKRRGDTRAGWYLNDEALAAKLCEVHAVPSLGSLESEVSVARSGRGEVQAVVGPNLIDACSPATPFAATQ